MKKRLFSCAFFMLVLIMIAFVGYLYAGAEERYIPEEYGQPCIESMEAASLTTNVIIQVPGTAKPKKEKVITLSKGDRNRLARLAMAEAEDEGLIGKALVICVAWNRVQSKSFPDTVKDVIYEKNQFAVIANGRYDRVFPDKECYDAVELFEYGWDKSRGALYFESKSDSTWHIDNLKYLFRYNNHYFYAEE